MLLEALTYTRKHINDDPKFSEENTALMAKFGETTWQDEIIEILLSKARAIAEKLNAGRIARTVTDFTAQHQAVAAGQTER